jgi:immune inhibitor A
MLRDAGKVISIMIALTFVIGAFAVVLATAGASNAPIAKQTATVTDDIIIDIDPLLEKQTIDLNTLIEPGASGLMASSLGNIYEINQSARFLTTYYGKAYYETGSGYMWFTKKAETNHSEVWVQNDTTYFAGDPRNADPNEYTVTDEQARYIATQFEYNIYENVSNLIGSPPPLDGENSLFKDMGRPYFGTNATGRVMIMIFNVVDDQFFDESYPYRIAGFHWSLLDSYYDRNIFVLDTKQWLNGTGPQPDLPGHAPYLYEAVVAHEYTHLLIGYHHPGEDTWLNEAMAMFSEWLCGYGIDYSYIDWFVATPDVSLTSWTDQDPYNNLAHYGASMLFAHYMYDHFGMATLKNLIIDNPYNGTEGVDYALMAQGYDGWNFDRVFRAWRLANLIHSDSPGAGLYNYENVDLDLTDGVRVYDYNPAAYQYVDSAALFFGNTWTAPDRNDVIYDTGQSLIGPYGTDYISVNSGFSNWAASLNPFDLKMLFNGQDVMVNAFPWEIIPGPEESSNVWWSGTGDLVDRNIGGVFDLSGMENATLSFDTYWDIEQYWDFGFVQVSTDSGATWTSLSNDYTTSEHDVGVMPSIAANLPGLTGTSEGWLNIEFDLGQYVGQVVWIQFRYMTDWGTYGEGWFIDNVALNGVIVDNADNIVYLANIPVYFDIDFLVTLYFPGCWGTDGIKYLPVVMNVTPSGMDEFFQREIGGMTQYLEMIILVSPNNGPCDYQFGMVNGVLGPV